MAERESWSPIRFDYRAAIDEFLAKSEPDVAELGRDAANRTREYTSSDQFRQDALEAAIGTVKLMREKTGALDGRAQAKALRAVEANQEWIDAEDKKVTALASGEAEIAAEQAEVQQGIDRTLDMLEVMQGIEISSAATATAVGEMEEARRLAEEDHKTQATFNKRMTWGAILLAGGSIIVGIGMPYVEYHFLKDAPSAPPEIVVIQESDLIVPPLLRRLGP